METRREKAMILLLGLGLCAILATSLWQRFSRPELVRSRFAPQGMEEAVPEKNLGALGELMRHVSEYPGDRGAILKLAEGLLALGQWGSAENFARKALALDPPDAPNPRTLYLLAIARHSQGEHEQAAELLEKSLEREENPRARYSLGILYLHYLRKPERGIEQLRKGLAGPDPGTAMRAAMESELKKAGAAPEKAPAGTGGRPAGPGE